MNEVMKLTEKIKRIMVVEHIGKAELDRMIREAALCNRGEFNRRYFKWLLRIENGELLDMRLDKLIEFGRGNSKVEEECGKCFGEGCRQCGWSGICIRHFSDTTAQKLNSYSTLTLTN